MSTQRTMPGGRVGRDSVPKGENGRGICRWCSLEVPPGRWSFCSDWCVEEWRLRTDPGHLRQRVFERDKGVCAACGLNCIAEFSRLRKLRGAARSRTLEDWQVGRRKSIWDADHIIPVAEGGGECDLSNLRTLCLKCHRLYTAQLRSRLRQKQQTPTSQGLTAKPIEPAPAE